MKKILNCLLSIVSIFLIIFVFIACLLIMIWALKQLTSSLGL